MVGLVMQVVVNVDSLAVGGGDVGHWDCGDGKYLWG